MNGSRFLFDAADFILDEQFTGKERDSESGNDCFGARYYTNAMGRFLSPDWSVQVEPVPYANLANPQTLNLYAYTANNPLSVLDLSGHGTRPGSGSNAQSNCMDEMADSGAPGGACASLGTPSGERSASEDVDDDPIGDQQQSNSSSNGTGFWSHVSNLLHGHSWNYVHAPVTATQRDLFVIIGADNPVVTAFATMRA
jgi:RHS repeat-associated protein